MKKATSDRFATDMMFSNESKEPKIIDVYSPDYENFIRALARRAAREDHEAWLSGESRDE